MYATFAKERAAVLSEAQMVNDVQYRLPGSQAISDRTGSHDTTMVCSMFAY